ncbi:cardiotrophin-like cytokine factor 1 [Protopterus annectens]|uniref:cardiotrophin-like cytokine factor 1 n=1 Tax=Protopterus annectens TaxID=7888 RepID=UPI001CFC0783|nr:cardiotrophin-like cytokine factor 1 [Protopterus annectens]
MFSTKSYLFIVLIAVFHGCEFAPIPAASTIAQTLQLSLFLQSRTADLLSTYLSYQGSPFSDSGFSSPDLDYTGVPKAEISYTAWRQMSAENRLKENIKAYRNFTDFFLLISDDQMQLNPSKSDLLTKLNSTKTSIEGLLNNLYSIMASMGFSLPPVGSTLSSSAYTADSFTRKVRGYVVCRDYGYWMDRTVRDFQKLSTDYPITAK